MSERRTTGTAGVVVVTAALLVAVVVLAVQWAAKERSFVASTPQPPPLVLTSVVPVIPGREICLNGVTLTPEGRIALVRVGTRGKPGVPLTGTLRAPGYREAKRIPGTWKDNDPLGFEFPPPPRVAHGSFCLRNDGPRPISVYASGDYTKTFLETRVDGRLQPANMQLTFSEPGKSSLRAHAGRIAEDLTLLRPGVIVTPVLWILFVLVLTVLPLGVGFALWRGLRENAEPSAATQGGAQAGVDLPGRAAPGAAGDELAPRGRAG